MIDKLWNFFNMEKNDFTEEVQLIYAVLMQKVEMLLKT